MISQNTSQETASGSATWWVWPKSPKMVTVPCRVPVTFQFQWNIRRLSQALPSTELDIRVFTSTTDLPTFDKLRRLRWSKPRLSYISRPIQFCHIFYRTIYLPFTTVAFNCFQANGFYNLEYAYFIAFLIHSAQAIQCMLRRLAVEVYGCDINFAFSKHQIPLQDERTTWLRIYCQLTNKRGKPRA